jgi:hypothetical protein
MAITGKPTVALLKSNRFLDISVSTFDTAIEGMIDDVTTRALSWMDRDDLEELNNEISGAIAKQSSYEFLRRKDPGLMQVTFADGTINKLNADEWLDTVESVLERNREFGL